VLALVDKPGKKDWLRVINIAVIQLSPEYIPLGGEGQERRDRYPPVWRRAQGELRNRSQSHRSRQRQAGTDRHGECRFAKTQLAKTPGSAAKSADPMTKQRRVRPVALSFAGTQRLGHPGFEYRLH